MHDSGSCVRFLQRRPETFHAQNLILSAESSLVGWFLFPSEIPSGVASSDAQMGGGRVVHLQGDEVGRRVMESDDGDRVESPTEQGAWPPYLPHSR